MVPLCLFLHLVEVLLKGCTALCGTGHSFQLSIISELTEEVSAPSSKSLTNKLNNTGPVLTPWGTALETGLQLELDVELGTRNPLGFYVCFCKQIEK